MKKKISALLLAAIMLCTGCESIDPEILDYVLEQVQKDGYITEECELVHKLSNVSAAIPNLISYDYIYREADSDELFCVRIYRLQEGEDKCEVDILTDVVIGEYIRDDNGETKRIPYLEDGWTLEEELEYRIPDELLPEEEE